LGGDQATGSVVAKRKRQAKTKQVKGKEKDCSGFIRGLVKRANAALKRKKGGVTTAERHHQRRGEGPQTPGGPTVGGAENAEGLPFSKKIALPCPPMEKNRRVRGRGGKTGLGGGKNQI